MATKATQAQGKVKAAKQKICTNPCELVPTNVPGPGLAQAVLHPKKDVFVLKVCKVAVNGARTSKLELELLTNKGPERRIMSRLDTREAQCSPEPCCCCANTRGTKTKKK